MSEQKLTPQQAQTIELLLSGNSQADTAKQVGVDPATINRWLNSRQYPQFVAAYNEAQQAVFSDNLQRLKTLHSKATDILIDILDNGDANQKLKVAMTIYKTGLPAFRQFETDPEAVQAGWDKDAKMKDVFANIF